MNTLSRIGAACGAIFAIVLTIAAGDGSHSFSGPRAVAGIAALTVAVPFIAYLCSVLRAQAGEGDRWLAGAALAAGTTGIVLKLGSGAPELALHQAHLIPGTQLYNTIDAIAGGATVLSLYPSPYSARPPPSSPSAPAPCPAGWPPEPPSPPPRLRSTAPSSAPASFPPCSCSCSGPC